MRRVNYGQYTDQLIFVVSVFALVALGMTLGIIALRAGPMPQPDVWLDVKIDRPAGYRCGQPNNDEPVLQACAIDNLIIKTNNTTVWVYDEDERILVCQPCTEFKMAVKYSRRIYVVGFFGIVKPPPRFDEALLDLRARNIDAHYKIIEVSP